MPSSYHGSLIFSGGSGYAGITGISGISGKSGYSGISGVSGIGPIGFSGYSGLSGISGSSGFGSSGSSGYSGTAGGLSVSNHLFMAYGLNAQGPITANTWTKVVIGTEEYDLSGEFNISTYAYTPTAAGYYLFCGRVGTTYTSAVDFRTAIYKNGAIYQCGMGSVRWTGGLAPGCPVASVVYMNGTTDYVEFYCRASAAVTLDAGISKRYFQGYQIR
jgi:hypothetical protein